LRPIIGLLVCHSMPLDVSRAMEGVQSEYSKKRARLFVSSRAL
jgi:hypothetical protein